MTMTKTAFTGVTIGSDGTIIGRRVTAHGNLPFIGSLAMLWIELAWDEQNPECVRLLALAQDGLGKPGAVPPGLEYLPVIRGSSFDARVNMLKIVRTYIPDTAMADMLGLSIGDLLEVLATAYQL